jgi:S1-C subfamily serine protease
MNFLLAWIIFSTLIWQGSSPLSVNTLVNKSYGSYFLPSFSEALQSGYVTHSGISLVPIVGGPASESGISSGSIIESVDGKTVYSVDDFIQAVKRNEKLEIQLRDTNSDPYTVTIMPKDGKIQAYL